MRRDIIPALASGGGDQSNDDEQQAFLLTDIERGNRSLDVDADGGLSDSETFLEPVQIRNEISTQSRYKVSKRHGIKTQLSATVWNRMRGPTPTRTFEIDPVLENLQEYPLKAIEKLIGAERASQTAVAGICIIWLVLFTAILIASLTNQNVHGYSSVTRLDCTSKLWPNTTYCGVNGTTCGPFDYSSFAFSCPAGCASAQVLEPHVVGDQEINYRSLVIGGPRRSSQGVEHVEYTYRGDSFLCPAAIHAGIIKESKGGCGVIHRTGSQNGFPVVTLNGISSIKFEPYFPLSFGFASAVHGCEDPQWLLLGLSTFTTMMIGIFTKSSSMFFATIFSVVFFQTALASDPPFFYDFATVLSTAFGRFLPAAGIGFVIFHFCAQKLLHDLRAPWEKTILYLSGCWVSALNQYTFDRLPISSLTLHDLKQQPGAIMTLLVILCVLLVIALTQAWAFRLEGRMLQILTLYLIFGILLTSIMLLPGVELRLHHYIIALLLLPGTSLQTRPSLLYQGLLVGMFINGIARWGFDSVVQTPADLRGEALLGSALLNITRTLTDQHTVTFTLSTMASGFDGIALLVNDVLYHQGSVGTLPFDLNWTRLHQNEPAYFRFAFTGGRDMGGIWYGDFTQPAVWYSNSTWKDIGL